MSKAFSSSRAPNTHVLLSALSINSSVSFLFSWLLSSSGKKKKGHLGERGHKCWLTFLYFIPLPDLGPKIFHCSVTCSVNSPRPSNICPVVFISSYSPEEGWIFFPVCDRLHAKITQILHPLLYTHTHTHTLFINYKRALL